MENAVREAFLSQERACEALGSPFTARLCRVLALHLDENTAVGDTVLSWQGVPGPEGDSVPLRLAGALHALVLTETIAPLTGIDEDDLWAVCKQVFENHQAFILERLTSPPQTNEVRRSGILLPGFLTIAAMTEQPLILSEVGASTGLNLQFDRYRYMLDTLPWGNAHSKVLLSPQWRGKPPPAPVDITVKDRAGCDLNPLDPSSANDRLRLRSYIWADQADRLQRTDNALAVAQENWMHVEKADAIDWLAQRLKTRHEGATHVIYHSVAWQYFPDDLKRRGEDLIREAGQDATASAPLARLQMEADDRPGSAAVTLQIWPTGERQELARADFHGRWIDWQGWSS